MYWKRNLQRQHAGKWLWTWILWCALGLSDSIAARWALTGSVSLPVGVSPSTASVLDRYPYLFVQMETSTTLYDCSASCEVKKVFSIKCRSQTGPVVANSEFFATTCTGFEPGSGMVHVYPLDGSHMEQSSVQPSLPERPVTAFGSSIALNERNVLAVLARRTDSTDFAAVFLYLLAAHLPPSLLSVHDAQVAGIIQPQLAVTLDWFMVSGRSNSVSIVRCFPDLKSCHGQESSTKILPLVTGRAIPAGGDFALVPHDGCEVAILHSDGTLQPLAPSGGVGEFCRGKAGVVMGVSNNWVIWVSSQDGSGWGMELDTKRSWELPVFPTPVHQVNVDQQGRLFVTHAKGIDMWQLAPPPPSQDAQEVGVRRLAMGEPTSSPSGGPALCFVDKQTVMFPLGSESSTDPFRFNRYKCVPNQFISPSPTSQLTELPSTVEPTPTATPPPTVNEFLCSFYSPTSSTNSATNPATSDTSCAFTACGGMTVVAATCPALGGTCNGDTYLRLVDSSGSTVALNDDGCGSGSDCALVQYTVTGASNDCRVFTLWQGCFQDDLCSGQSIVNFYFDGQVPTIAPATGNR